MSIVKNGHSFKTLLGFEYISHMWFEVVMATNIKAAVDRSFKHSYF